MMLQNSPGKVVVSIGRIGEGNFRDTCPASEVGALSLGLLSTRCVQVSDVGIPPVGKGIKIFGHKVFT